MVEGENGDRLRPVIAIDEGRDAVSAITRLSAKDLPTRRNLFAASHFANDEGITAFGQGPGAEVRGEKQSIIVETRQPMLGFREMEPFVAETETGRIILPDHDRILTAVRQADETVSIFRRQTVCPLEDPVCALSFGQGVNIKDRAPLRSAAEIVGLLRVPPDTTDVRGVLPEVIDPHPPKGGLSDPILGGQNRKGVRTKTGITRIRLENRLRAGVLLLDPGGRTGRRDLFKPQELVGRRNRRFAEVERLRSFA